MFGFYSTSVAESGAALAIVDIGFGRIGCCHYRDLCAIRIKTECTVYVKPPWLLAWPSLISISMPGHGGWSFEFVAVEVECVMRDGDDPTKKCNRL